MNITLFFFYSPRTPSRVYVRQKDAQLWTIIYARHLLKVNPCVTGVEEDYSHIIKGRLW